MHMKNSSVKAATRRRMGPRRAAARRAGYGAKEFLADRTIGRAYGTVCRLSSVCRLSVCL